MSKQSSLIEAISIPKGKNAVPITTLPYRQRCIRVEDGDDRERESARLKNKLSIVKESAATRAITPRTMHYAYKEREKTTPLKTQEPSRIKAKGSLFLTKREFSTDNSIKSSR